MDSEGLSKVRKDVCWSRLEARSRKYLLKKVHFSKEIQSRVIACRIEAKTITKLRDILYEPICSSAVAITTDMWTVNFRNLNYLDLHPFWSLALRNSNWSTLVCWRWNTSERTPTSATIFRFITNDSEKYNLISFSAPVVTDKASTGRFRDFPRLDWVRLNGAIW